MTESGQSGSPGPVEGNAVSLEVDLLRLVPAWRAVPALPVEPVAAVLTEATSGFATENFRTIKNGLRRNMYVTITYSRAE